MPAADGFPKRHTQYEMMANVRFAKEFADMPNGPIHLAALL